MSAPGEGADLHLTQLPEDDCLSCPEGIPTGECAKSLRPCGHHCNHSWENENCHWCGWEYDPDSEDVAEMSPPTDGYAEAYRDALEIQRLRHPTEVKA